MSTLCNLRRERQNDEDVVGWVGSRKESSPQLTFSLSHTDSTYYISHITFGYPIRIVKKSDLTTPVIKQVRSAQRTTLRACFRPRV